MYKKVFIILVAVFIFAQYIGVSHGASSDSGSSENYLDLYKDAKKFDYLNHIDVLKQNLKVMDSTALSLTMDNDIPIIVFNLNEKGSIKKALFGEKIGTQIGGDYHEWTKF